MPTAKRRPSGQSVVARAITPDDLKVRLQERDRRLAADNRSEAQRWLGDPPLRKARWRSAATSLLSAFGGKADIPFCTAYVRL